MGNNIYGPMTWARAEKLLQGRCFSSRRLANNTYLEREEVEDPYGVHGQDIFHIRFHNTRILSFYPDDSMSVQMGRWQTITTKDRLNIYSGLHIYSDKGMWYVRSMSGKRLDSVYEDGMVRLPFGELVGPDRKTPLAEDPRPRKRLRRQATTYSLSFMNVLEKWERVYRRVGAEWHAGMLDCMFCSDYIQTGSQLLKYQNYAAGYYYDNHMDGHMKDFSFVASWLRPATGYGWWELVGDGRGMKARRKKAAGQLRDWLVEKIEELEAQPEPTMYERSEVMMGRTVDGRKITNIDTVNRVVTFDNAK